MSAFVVMVWGVVLFLGLAWWWEGRRRVPGELPPRPGSGPGTLRQLDRGGSLCFQGRSHTWNRGGERIVVEPETETLRKVRARGLQDIRVGWDEFDTRFLVRSSDPRVALRALDSRMQAWAEAVHAAVTGRPGNHAAPLPGEGPVPESLAPLDTSGVDLACVEVEVEGGECQLCGDAVGDSPRCCTYCGLPHHPECWDFHGGCTTYACPGGP